MTPGTDWGICATIKAPLPQVMAFLAHHLALGAAEIWLHFDDPQDPAAEAVAGLDRVTAIRCDDAYWNQFPGKRPERHQNRQGQNVRRTYRRIGLGWLCHIDVDEFIWPSQAIPDVLAEVPPDAPMLRMAPWEALHSPSLADDIFTARYFRAALRGSEHHADRDRIFGAYAFLLPMGVLSHAAGKCFFRTGVKGLQPRLHGASLDGGRATGIAFDPRLPLLHFHAQDRQAWLERLPFRLERGAYQHNLGLTTYLQLCSKADRAKFHDRVQTATPQMLDQLRDLGALIEADLDLRTKVTALQAGKI